VQEHKCRGGQGWPGAADAEGVGRDAADQQADDNEGQKGEARMTTDTLLVELLTEELPPKALPRLMEAFSHGLYEGLKDKGLLLPGAEVVPYASPRRLAVTVTQVLDRQPDRVVERKGPAVATALDADGKPTPALAGFAKSCGVEIARLERQNGDKGEYFVYRAKQPGEPLKAHLAPLVEAVLKKLPVPKTMRWGAGEAQFVRPVHGVILLHGRKVVPGAVLGLKSGNKTRGHRFLAGKPVIAVASARDYAKTLKQQGKVIAGFEARREAIARGLDAAADKLAKGARWDVGKSAELVDEVAGITEFPVVLTGGFDPAFLEVPKECLIISMQQHQKYFPLATARGELLPNFLFVSNMQAASPRQIVHGNERVLRARLSDARFFYDQDRKQPLAARVPRLANVVYHNKLGSQLARVERLTKLAGEIAERLGADRAAAERAAHLAKADLLTEMVGEFPELQGIMGRYYARHDGEPAAVAAAIEQHYWPKGAGAALPDDPLAVSLALADKLDTLVGIFGIGLVPTGDKDPFGLRRAALGVVRLLLEKRLPLDVRALYELARSHFPAGVLADSVAQDLHAFTLERLKPYLRDQGFEVDEIDAVLALHPTRLDDLVPRLKALQLFRVLPEAEALAAANKRIRNILRQAGDSAGGALDAALLAEPAERRLAQELDALRTEVEALLKSGDHTAALRRLAALRGAVDEFFDKVMVMAEDAQLRRNRLALLAALSRLFLGTADIARLQPRTA
jgi:glycyl-tRNA synthetase beta chain